MRAVLSRVPVPALGRQDPGRGGGGGDARDRRRSLSRSDMPDLAGTRLILVGCGKMGGAMLRGWLARGLAPADVAVVEPTAAALGDLADAARGLRHGAAARGLPAGFVPHVVVLAVKPQMMDEAIGHYRRFAGPETVFLSIAAGKTIGYFQAPL